MALMVRKKPKVTRQGNGKNSYFSTHKRGKNNHKRGKNTEAKEKNRCQEK